VITDELPRVHIGHLPTPLEPLPRLSAALEGPEIWIKRDDQTGLATGGNKTRKLEFLVADAQYRRANEGATVRLITAGAAQSNHARQTAAAAAKFGLRCTLVLRGAAPDQTQGNLLLDRLFGADVLWSGDLSVADCMEQAAEDARVGGEFPYVIPYGGSNPVGASGYVAAMDELLSQSAELGVDFDWIVFASSSGGTQAGLLVGATALGFAGRIVGISVGPAAGPLRENVGALASQTAGYLGLGTRFSPDDIWVEDSYVGDGYGVMGLFERDAIYELARSEGILLDPVYTGRAFGGLLDMVGWDTFEADDRVLFWHTGGTPALFAYAQALAPAGGAVDPPR
jgi:D-cysteine desulfhydrase family pyridoxal phosphate-dependent enzyme